MLKVIAWSTIELVDQLLPYHWLRLVHGLECPGSVWPIMFVVLGLTVLIYESYSMRGYYLPEAWIIFHGISTTLIALELIMMILAVCDEELFFIVMVCAKLFIETRLANIKSRNKYPGSEWVKWFVIVGLLTLDHDSDLLQEQFELMPEGLQYVPETAAYFTAIEFQVLVITTWVDSIYDMLKVMLSFSKIVINETQCMWLSRQFANLTGGVSHKTYMTDAQDLCPDDLE
ncbi:hypothetical protein KR018_004627 [Drosophila ironensis]|nr:hypothetical protein KR018_004627 [Drosophila ironensis]